MLPGISISGQVPHLRGTLHHDAAILLTGGGRLKKRYCQLRGERLQAVYRAIDTNFTRQESDER